MNELTVRIVGTSPLLMHNERGANITDPDVKKHKALTNKRQKTDDDHYEIAKSEYFLSAYADANGVPIMPTRNIWSSTVLGGRLAKLGKKIERGTLILADNELLQHPGAKTFEGLWKAGPKNIDMRGVVVNGRRIMRCRPRFDEWAVQTTFQYDASQVDEREIIQSLSNAGSYVGLGDFRPECSGKMGRFSVEKVG